MLKNLKYLVAMGLLAFGYTNQANALFGMCTGDLGREGGPDAYKCVEKTTADKDPNFLAAFVRFHCKGKPDRATAHYCEIAEEKLSDADEIVSNKRNASNKRKADALSQKTTKAKASAKEKNRKAQAGEDDGFMASMKSKFSKSKKPAKQEVDEDEDMEEEEEEEEEDMRPAKKGKYSLSKSKSTSGSSSARNMRQKMSQFDEDEEEEEEDYEPAPKRRRR